MIRTNSSPVGLLVLRRRGCFDLSAQLSTFKHQQPASVRPCNQTLCRHPRMTQKVDGLHLWEAALFQRSLCIVKQLKHPSSTHTQLHVVVRVEADLEKYH